MNMAVYVANYGENSMFPARPSQTNLLSLQLACWNRQTHLSSVSLSPGYCASLCLNDVLQVSDNITAREDCPNQRAHTEEPKQLKCILSLFWRLSVAWLLAGCLSSAPG